MLSPPIGFTLLSWQTSQTINFAQGEFVMLPAFFALAGMNWLGLPFSLAALLAITLAMLMLGVLFKAIVVDPLIRQGVLPLVSSRPSRSRSSSRTASRTSTAPRRSPSPPSSPTL